MILFQAFTKNGQDTITTKDPAFQEIIGRGPTFSFEDLQVIHRCLGCDGKGYKLEKYRSADH